ncbi:MAG: hypothetical protein F6K09_32595 [Merismopedia sp. SIO2A8]|nr:hypothetical protein [Symploca sp. SIO2B6]NET53234.1 hypothetical protein [Merismopedia sp. SIO2A8]
MTQKTTTQKATQYVDSEHYRQMLVRDGDRRFQEWHTNFLRYQKQFLAETHQNRTKPTRD